MEQANMSYAGFWKRFLAYLIDGFILSIVGFIIFIPMLFFLGLSFISPFLENRFDMITASSLIMFFAAYFIGIIIYTVAGWLYFALMESSSKGATLGKMALSIRVVDLNGQRISFARATGRYFGKIISGMIFMVGYIIAGFTEKKQALHDMMAGCLVINS